MRPYSYKQRMRDDFAMVVLSELDYPAIADVRLLLLQENPNLSELLKERWENAEIMTPSELPDSPVAENSGANSRFMVADYPPYPLDEKYWDLMIVQGGLSEIRNLDEHLANLAFGLMDDGLLYFEAPNLLVFSVGESGYRPLATDDHRYHWHLTRDEWMEKLEKAGFEVVKNYRGSQARWEFVWLLRKKRQPVNPDESGQEAQDEVLETPPEPEQEEEDLADPPKEPEDGKMKTSAEQSKKVTRNDKKSNLSAGTRGGRSSKSG